MYVGITATGTGAGTGTVAPISAEGVAAGGVAAGGVEAGRAVAGGICEMHGVGVVESKIPRERVLSIQMVFGNIWAKFQLASRRLATKFSK